MGSHYVPRHHLRRFSIAGKPGIVWMYDTQDRIWREASVSTVAAERDFYSPKVEKGLAEDIENQGKKLVDKLLRRESLDNTERTLLSRYMLTMATRGPRQRKKSLEHVPAAWRDTVEEVRAEIEEWSRRGADSVAVEARRKELANIEAKYADEIPPSILELIRTPFWSERTVELVHNMHWHIMPSPSGMYYVTSDTPAHIFEGSGVGTLDSEFTFAMSQVVALIGEHRRPAGISFEETQARIVKEVNRRMISHAERFIFSPRPDGWIADIATKGPQLNQINWI